MRSNLGRLRRTSSRSLVEQLATLTSVGDGSTLSLDFTTGVLDPRLTFTRLGNATFINSSGLVQYADANMVVNADFVGAGTGNAPTAWNVSAGINLTIPATGVRRAVTTTAAQNWIQSAVFSTVQGLTYSTSVLVSEVSGQHYANTVGITAGATVVQYYRNGSAVGQFDTAVAGLITVVWTATTTNTHNVRCGVGSTGSNVANGTCEFTQPRTVVGNIAQPAYFANSSTTAAYHAPRFDYDPTSIGTPRGLLIEGAATNVCEQGQYCWGAGTTSSWGRTAGVNINSVNGTAGANAVPRIDGPDGGSLTGTSIFKDSGSTFVRLNQSVAVVQNTTYTFSAYVRAPSGGNPYIRLAAFNGGTWLNTTGGCTLSSVTITNTGSAGSVFNGVPSGSWVRVWVTFTTQAAQTTATIAFYPDADTSNAATMYCWGSQVETGSGPSSVIPTGASTGSRAADSCDCTSGNFSSWYTQGPGTLLVHARPFRQNYSDLASLCTSTADPRLAIRTNDPPSAAGITLYGNNAATIVNRKTSNAYSINNLLKTAVGLQQGNYAVVLNGGTVATDPGSGTFPTALNRLTIGHTALGGEANAWISLIKYWPTRLPDAQLQSLTT